MTTRQQKLRYALMGGLLLALLLGAAAFFPALVLADGYESYKDEPTAYAPPRIKRSGYISAYTVRTTRGGWHCPAEFKRHECRRIQAEIDRRRAREVVRARPHSLRDYASRPTARVQYRDISPSERRAFGGRRCAGRFRVEGGARPSQALARGSALKEWRKLVRRSERGGLAYMDEKFSPDFRIGNCKIVNDGGWLTTCRAEGLACQP
jgi:hypothetical protein